MRALGYGGSFKFFCKVHDKGLSDGLMLLETDSDVYQAFVEHRYCKKVVFYVEHSIDTVDEAGLMPEPMPTKSPEPMHRDEPLHKEAAQGHEFGEDNHEVAAETGKEAHVDVDSSVNEVPNVGVDSIGCEALNVGVDSVGCEAPNVGVQTTNVNVEASTTGEGTNEGDKVA